MSALAFHGVKKRYGKTEVLRGVDLEIPKGSRVAVLGPSGCGKTTLLRLAAGLETPDAGVVEIEGRRASEAGRLLVGPRDRQVSLVFQDLALWPNLCALDNVALPLRSSRGAAKADEDARRWLSFFGLEKIAARLPGGLSGGEQQRVALARALAPDPPILLLDEPLTGLDRERREPVREELRRLERESGKTIVYVTHDHEDAFRLADRLVLLRDGRVEQEGAPIDVYRRPKSAWAARATGAATILEAEVRAGRAALAFGEIEAAGVTDGPVELCVRPEDVRLAANGPCGGVVIESRFVRPGFEIGIACEGARLIALSGSALEPGVTVRFAIDRAVPLGESAT